MKFIQWEIQKHKKLLKYASPSHSFSLFDGLNLGVEPVP